MSTEDSFPDSTHLTPEEQVRENQRLNSIDKQQQAKARHALSEFNEDSEEGQLEKAKRIYELTGIAQEAARQMTEVIDPRYEQARNITIDELVSKPSRLLFLKREVVVMERRELAAWIIAKILEDVRIPYLGRDGQLYGIYDDDQGYIVKKIDLPALHMEDLLLLHTGIEELIIRYERSPEDQ